MTTTIELIHGIEIEIPAAVIADMTPDQLEDVRSVAVHALLERIEEIRSTR